MRRLSIVLSAACVFAACGSSPTLTDYAEEAEALVAAMEADFASLDAEWESQTPNIEGARVYWQGRLETREEFLDAVRDLDPPDAITDLHQQALDVFERITSADEALAAHVLTLDSISEHWAWVDTPEGRAADMALADVFAFCRQSQEEFDATAGRESSDGVPWVPAEMTEVVKVAFGCPG